MKTLRGLNWGHRRALAPMEAASRVARETQGVDVEWTVQSLAAFEHGLDAEIADRFDLVVFDHPFCGSVAAGAWMRPLDDIDVSLNDRDFVGASLASYRYAGHLWAVPVDGATQAAVYRPDLIEADALPARWSDVARLAHDLRRHGRAIGIATRSPHGILALLALCANIGAPLATDPWADPLDRDALAIAAEMLRETASLGDARCSAMNAIDLHDAMVREDTIAYCPLAYTYTTYAESDMRRRLAFAPFPGPQGNSLGSVLGGTGIGVTRGCRDSGSAMAFVELLAMAHVQCETFMRNHGQPGRVEGWRGVEADAAFAGAHATLHDAVAGAWMRPRFPGYIGWQGEAGDCVERFLSGDLSIQDLHNELVLAWRRRMPPLPVIA